MVNDHNQSRIKTLGGPEASINWRPPLMGARRKFSKRGQTTNTYRVDHFFDAPTAQTKIFAFLATFFTNFTSRRVASAEGASKNFWGVS